MCFTSSSEPIEQVSAWLFRVARSRIIDRFRKKKEQPLVETVDETDDSGDEYRLDLLLPANDAGLESAYARSVLLEELQRALDGLPKISVRFSSLTNSRGAALKICRPRAGEREYAASAQALCGATSANPLASRV
ncbi:hypothetical protein OKW28_007637 [Paraburkholderia sp. 40]